MFVGHFAAAFALGARSKAAPIGGLLAGTAVLDVLFGAFAIAGIEEAVVHDPPVFANLELVRIGFSHSLTGSLVWSAAAFAVGWRLWGTRAAGALLAAAVFSHYVLDVLSHRPDIPVVGFGSPVDWKLGTGLAAHPAAFFAVEAAWCLLAVRAYASRKRRLWWTMGVLLVLWSNQVFGFVNPPPPGQQLAGAVTIGSFVLAGIALAWAARPRAAPTR